MSREKDNQQIVDWLYGLVNFYPDLFNLGVHNTGSNLHHPPGDQTQYYLCHGCSGRGEARWSNGWKIEFEHKEGCNYLKMLEVFKQMDNE